MCPADDNFLTSSRDGTVRLWDAKTAACTGKMDVTTCTTSGSTADSNIDPHTCHAVYDHTGLVFCVTAAQNKKTFKGRNNIFTGNEHCVHLYDARNFSGGAFAEMQVTHASIRDALLLTASTASSTNSTSPVVWTKEEADEMSSAPWSNVQFNASGKQLLVTTASKSIHNNNNNKNKGGGLVMLVDGFDASVGHVFNTSSSYSASRSAAADPAVGNNENVDPNSYADTPSACFTPDDKTVLVAGGSNDNNDGVVRCYSAESGVELSKLENNIESSSSSGGGGGGGGMSSVGSTFCSVACSPNLAVVATSCDYHTALWSW